MCPVTQRSVVISSRTNRMHQLSFERSARRVQDKVENSYSRIRTVHRILTGKTGHGQKNIVISIIIFDIIICLPIYFICSTNKNVRIR